MFCTFVQLNMMMMRMKMKSMGSSDVSVHIWWLPPAALGGMAALAPAWTSTKPILCLLFLCSVICKHKDPFCFCE